MSDKKVDNAPATESAAGWWSGIVGEFKRITWPTKQQLAKMTIAAIVTSGIVGAVIFGFDIALGNAYDGLGWLADQVRP